MRVRWAMVVLALVPAMGGCAMMARGTSQNFDIATEPPGAKVETTLGKGCAATPCTLKDVGRNSNFTVTLSKPGYHDETVKVTNETSVEGGAAMGASFLIPGGILWSAIDWFSGAPQDLKPNPLKVELKPEGGNPTGAVAE